MKPEKIRLIVIIFISVLIGYYIGVSKIELDWRNYRPSVQISGKEPPPSETQTDFSQFWLVLQKLEEKYYDKKAINPKKIVDGAISGMVNSLDDPYTVYLPAAQNNDFKQGLAGKFEGIGAELGMKGKDIIVVAPLDGSPALKAGIKAGDIIAKVDDQYTAGWSLNQTVEKIRGPKGTEVRLTILRKNDEEPHEIKIIRDTISVKSLTSWTKKVSDVEDIEKTDTLKAAANDKVIYIRLSQFGDTANKEWTSLATKLKGEIDKDKSIKGVIFDLRNNPGGYLADAGYIASEFIQNGTVVIQEDKNGERTNFPASGKGQLTDVPVIILLNKGSASASEIVAGALRDHNRAKIVGETSFGKGTIQEAEDLGGDAGLHITIAKWLTPNGTWVHQKGLKPDVEVDLDKNKPDVDLQLEKAIEELVK